MDCSLPGSSAHGFLQARITGVGSPGDLPDLGMHPLSSVSPALAGGFFTTQPPGKPSVLSQKSNNQGEKIVHSPEQDFPALALLTFGVGPFFLSGVENVPCLIECLAASLASPHQLSVALIHSQLLTTNISPGWSKITFPWSTTAQQEGTKPPMEMCAVLSRSVVSNSVSPHGP